MQATMRDGPAHDRHNSKIQKVPCFQETADVDVKAHPDGQDMIQGPSYPTIDVYRSKRPSIVSC